MVLLSKALLSGDNWLLRNINNLYSLISREVSYMGTKISTWVNGEKVTIECVDGNWQGNMEPFKPIFEGVQKEFFKFVRPIVEKSCQIPMLLAELSYSDKKKTIELLRPWLNHKMPITPLYDALIKALVKYDDKRENFLKKCTSPPPPFEFKSENHEERVQEMWSYAKNTFPIQEQFEKNLCSLTYSNPKEAIRILRLWGEGKKSSPQLWEEAEKALGAGDGISLP
jgi:hypothetical protein